MWNDFATESVQCVCVCVFLQAVLVFNNQEEVITMHGEAPDVTIPSMLLPFYVSEDLRSLRFDH